MGGQRTGGRYTKRLLGVGKTSGVADSRGFSSNGWKEVDTQETKSEKRLDGRKPVGEMASSTGK